MKKILSIIVIGLVFSSNVFAYNPLETTSEARARHRSEEYQARQNNPYGGEPLGGYSDRLGDPRGQVHERSKQDSLDRDGNRRYERDY